jgi:hypothetical protein
MIHDIKQYINQDIIFLILSIVIVLILIYEKKEHFNEAINFHTDFINNVKKDSDLKKTYQKILENQEKDEEDEKLNKYKKLYYNVPFDNKSPLVDKTLDKSVLKNYRVNPDYHSYAHELTFTEVDKIIKQIKPSKKYENKVYKYDPLPYGKHFVDIFNQLYFLLDMNNYYHKSDKRVYELIDVKFLLKDLIVDSVYKIVYEVKIFKKMKDYGFVFQNTIKHNTYTNITNYLNIDLVGIVSEEDIIFNTKKSKEQKSKEQKCKFDLDIKKDECFKIPYGSDNLNSNDFISGEYLKPHLTNFFEDKYLEGEINKNYKQFRCFGRHGFNEAECKSYDKERKTHGVWDRPCNNNNECPFYKKNKNYENERGGCKKGFCEMPINTKTLSYRYYDKNVKPFCYNCEKEGCLGDNCYNCCDEQEDRDKYPNLKSSDYIFKNDYRERK